jgi:hypothetical protein
MRRRHLDLAAHVPWKAVPKLRRVSRGLANATTGRPCHDPATRSPPGQRPLVSPASPSTAARAPPRPLFARQRKKSEERRDAQDELHSAAQARAWADGDFDADRGFAFATAWAARLIRAGRAASEGGRRKMNARPCCVWAGPPPPKMQEAAEARAWADGDVDADHGFAFDDVCRPAH